MLGAIVQQDGVPATPGSTATSTATPASAEATPLDEAPSDDAIAEALQPFDGDLSSMQERRRIRMLVPFSCTNYFLDKGRQVGVTAEAGHALEEFVNKQHSKPATFSSTSPSFLSAGKSSSYPFVVITQVVVSELARTTWRAAPLLSSLPRLSADQPVRRFQSGSNRAKTTGEAHRPS
jgi:hypothetical protein